MSPDVKSWDIDRDLTLAVEQREGLDFWQSEAGGVGMGLAVFMVPDAEKELWHSLDSKVGASTEKAYSGGMRGRLGDLPGEERIREPQPGYRVIIGSFWVWEFTRSWVEQARERGLTAWIESAVGPEGMHVVVIRRGELEELAFLVEVVKDHGYHDAFVSRVSGK